MDKGPESDIFPRKDLCNKILQSIIFIQSDKNICI